MSLSGRTVVTTRAREQGDELGAALRARGAEVVELPVIAIVPAEDPVPLDRALDRLGAYDMVLFGSKNAAEPFLARAEARGLDVSAIRFGCVGRKTASWLAKRVASEILVPPVFRGEAFAGAVVEALGGDISGRRFLIPEADRARGEIAAGLRARGAEVDEVVAYRIADAPPPSPEDLARVDAADAFTFLSGQTIEAFLRVVPGARRRLEAAVVAVIGPVAAETASRLGVRVDVVPEEATIEGLAAALDRLP